MTQEDNALATRDLHKRRSEWHQEVLNLLTKYQPDLVKNDPYHNCPPLEIDYKIHSAENNSDTYWFLVHLIRIAHDIVSGKEKWDINYFTSLHSLLKEKLPEKDIKEIYNFFQVGGRQDKEADYSEILKIIEDGNIAPSGNLNTTPTEQNGVDIIGNDADLD